MENIFFSTNIQKVLRFLVRHSTKALLASDIRKSLGLSRAGVNFALQELSEKGLVQRESKGKAYIYQIKSEHPALKQFKVLDWTTKLYPLIRKLKVLANKVILFGSCARGENVEDSDIDLLIVTHNKEEVNKTLESFRKLPLKPVIKTPIELEDLEKKNPIFYLEVTRGIILFEKDNEC